MAPHTSASTKDLVNAWAHLPGLYWVADKDFTLVAISNAYLSLMGATREAVLQKNIFTLFQDPSLAPLVGGTTLLRESLEKIRTTGQQVSLPAQKGVEKHANEADEPPQFLDLLYIPVTNEHNQITHIIHQAVEVAQTESIDIPEISQIYRALAANFPHGAAFVLDRELRYLLAEGQALRDTGLTPADFEGKTIWEAQEADLAQLYEPYYRQALAGEPFRHEHKSHGHHYASHGTPLHNEKGEVYAVLAVSYDITERKRTEEALQKSEKHLSAIFAQAAVGISEISLDGRFIRVNEKLCQMLRCSGETLLNASVPDITHPADIEKSMSVFKNLIETGEAVSLDKRYLRTDGTIVWANSLLTRLDDAEGHPQTVLAVTVDLTERRQMEEALKRAKEEAEQAAHAKEDFLAHMSHEIRTPLNAVIGISNLLLQQKPRPAQLESLQTLKFSAENLMVLVNDILDFSKIQAGKITLEEKEVNLRKLLYSLQKAHQPHAAEQRNTLQFQIDDRIPELVLTDQLKLSQILHNLVSNAVKFTKKGLIKVEANLNRKEGERVWIDFSVSDTGIGISQDKLSTIFDIFTQADNSTVREYGGTGLGLSITKLLLELMDSHIEVKSREGAGARFFFTLPLKESRIASPAIKSPDHRATQEDLKHIRLLLVEDYEINRRILKQFFASWWALTPDEAANGQEAVKMAKKEQYDLILMDVRMPVMDGYQAAQAIRNLSNPNYQKVPIIALTADTLHEIKKHPEAEFFTDVITKPFDPENLRQKLTHHASPEKIKAGSSSEISAPEALDLPLSPQVNIKKVEAFFKGNTKQIKRFLETALHSLQSFQNDFDRAMIHGDEQGLSDHRHKITLLLSMLDLEGMKVLLEQSQELLRKNAPKEQIHQMQLQQKAMVKQILTALEEYLQHE